MRRASARIPSYDVLRFVATLCVVFIHVSAYGLLAMDPEWPWLLSANRHLIRYAVPAFFLITGALVWGRAWDGSPGHYLAFMRRRITIIVFPYLAWSVVYILAIMAAGSSRGLTEIVSGLVTGKTWYHLYFVPAIMIVYALTPVVDRVSRVSPELLFGLSLGVHLGVPLMLEGGIPLVPAALESLAGSVAVYLPYAALGSLIARRGGPSAAVVRFGWPLVLYASLELMANRTLVLPTDALLYRSLTAVTACGVLVGVFGACMLLAKWSGLLTVAERVGPWTYTVYLVHPLIIEGARELAPSGLSDFLWGDHVGIWMTYVGVTALSFAIGWGQTRILERRAAETSGSETVTI